MWGVQTWDAQGRPNNYGIRPVYYVDTVRLAVNQAGSWNFTVPDGYRLGFYAVAVGANGEPARRSITVSGSSVNVTNSGGSYFSGPMVIYVYLY